MSIKNLLICIMVAFGISLNAENNDEVKNLDSENVEIHVVTGYTAILGEGALWDYKNNRLLWVDIQGKKLMVYSPDRHKNSIYNLPQKPGTVVPIDSVLVLLALEDGIYTFNLTTEELVLVADPEPKEYKVTTRFNDGKCDPAGRFWVGSMQNKALKPEGASLFSIDSDFKVRNMATGVSTSNGIAWSLNKKRMYYIDTPTKTVAAFDYNNETGDISNRTVAVEIPETLGYPDGSTIDAEGMLWIAMWDGHCITRWNPETGVLLQKIDLPALKVTSLAFGGKNFDELFITTASYKLNEETLNAYPLSGKLLKINVGVKGVKANYFNLKH